MIRVNIEICNRTINLVILIEISIMTLIDIVVVMLNLLLILMGYPELSKFPQKFWPPQFGSGFYFFCRQKIQDTKIANK